MQEAFLQLSVGGSQDHPGRIPDGSLVSHSIFPCCMHDVATIPMPPIEGHPCDHFSGLGRALPSSRKRSSAGSFPPTDWPPPSPGPLWAEQSDARPVLELAFSWVYALRCNVTHAPKGKSASRYSSGTRACPSRSTVRCRKPSSHRSDRGSRTTPEVPDARFVLGLACLRFSRSAAPATHAPNRKSPSR